MLHSMEGKFYVGSLEVHKPNPNPNPNPSPNPNPNPYGAPFVSKLYINLECRILVREIYKCPTTFVNVLLHL